MPNRTSLRAEQHTAVLLDSYKKQRVRHFMTVGRKVAPEPLLTNEVAARSSRVTRF
jgi:hypothetical protein